MTCKWAYLPQAGGWQRDFFDLAGLSDLFERGNLPETATPIGSNAGPLTAAAAAALGLSETCHVGTGLIDAHAGALGAIGRDAAMRPGGHLTLVGGTSSCVMALSAEPRPIHGAWGPYPDVVMPESWLNEAGQSATGALLDHLVRVHPAGGVPAPHLHAAILRRVAELRHAEGAAFAARLHLLPDFHGNRSPLGDPVARGVIAGLTLDESFDDLCRLYYRAAVAIALGIRHILEALAVHGYDTSRLHVTGGHVHNPLLMELYADVAGVTLIEPQTIDATLLGVAMVASVAAGIHADTATAAAAMAAPSIQRGPDAGARAGFDRDYRVFTTMLAQRDAIDRLDAG